MLDTIVTRKRVGVQQDKAAVPLASLEERIARRQQPVLDLALALDGDGVRLIAEVKKASPSRGVLRADLDPVALAKTYERSGAAAVSVLTEKNYFKGSTEDLIAIRNEVKLPLLRKDFIIDPYQIYEARAFGADALLLIVAILNQDQLKRFIIVSRSLDMRCLVEVHNESEVKRALDAGAEIIGINSRDLNTFTVDLDTVRRLRPLIPAGVIVVAESGITSRSDINKLESFGVKAVLVGEALVMAENTLGKMRELIG